MTQVISLLFPLSIILTLLAMCAANSIIHTECSPLCFTPATPYELNVNTLLTSLVNSASVSNFNKFKISPPGCSQLDVVYGLYQCQGDLSFSDCRDCVASSMSQLRTTCPVSVGGSIQLEGCFVKYDNTYFFGVEDKTEVLKMCGPTIGYNSDALNCLDDALTYLVAGNGQYFRKGGSGSVQGVAQCIQDLSASQCEDCLMNARGRLRSECETSSSGDMYLGKCYIRYKDHEVLPVIGNNGDEDHQCCGSKKVPWITIAIIVGVILIISLSIILIIIYIIKARRKNRCCKCEFANFFFFTFIFNTTTVNLERGVESAKTIATDANKLATDANKIATDANKKATDANKKAEDAKKKAEENLKERYVPYPYPYPYPVFLMECPHIRCM